VFIQQQASTPIAPGAPDSTGTQPADPTGATSDSSSSSSSSDSGSSDAKPDGTSSGAGGKMDDTTKPATDSSSDSSDSPVPAAPPSRSLIPDGADEKDIEDEDAGVTDDYQEPTYTGDALDNSPNQQKYIQALDGVRADLVNKGQQLTHEKEWAESVQDMIDQYKIKVKNVHAHMEKLRKEMKGLLKKKAQIENIATQEKVEERLQEAEKDKQVVDDALSHVRTQTLNFATKRSDLEGQIGKLEDQLNKLKGEPVQNAKNQAAEEGVEKKLAEEEQQLQDTLAQEKGGAASGSGGQPGEEETV